MKEKLDVEWSEQNNFEWFIQTVLHTWHVADSGDDQEIHDAMMAFRRYWATYAMKKGLDNSVCWLRVVDPA